MTWLRIRLWGLFSLALGLAGCAVMAVEWVRWKWRDAR
jgi:hypothetical protein